MDTGNRSGILKQNSSRSKTPNNLCTNLKFAIYFCGADTKFIIGNRTGVVDLDTDETLAMSPDLYASPKRVMNSEAAGAAPDYGGKRKTRGLSKKAPVCGLL